MKLSEIKIENEKEGESEKEIKKKIRENRRRISPTADIIIKTIIICIVIDIPLGIYFYYKKQNTEKQRPTIKLEKTITKNEKKTYSSKSYIITKNKK